MGRLINGSAALFWIVVIRTAALQPGHGGTPEVGGVALMGGVADCAAPLRADWMLETEVRGGWLVHPAR